jgi:hypothetical protein
MGFRQMFQATDRLGGFGFATDADYPEGGDG